jgi:phosphatidate cytidylyltransferase
LKRHKKGFGASSYRMQNKVKKSFDIKRHIVAVFFLPVLFAYVYFLPPLPFFLALLIVVGMIATWEFYVMYKVQARLYIPAVLIGGVLFYLSCRHPAYFLDGIFISLFLLLLVRLLLIANPSGCMSEVGPLGVGFFYVSGFLSFQWLLRKEVLGLEYIFLLYISVWLADSMAYYIGTYMGKNKLYPSVSPKKTIEGAVGSVVGGILGTVITKTVFGIPGLTIIGAIAIGATLGITAIIGDLIESMFKRDAGIKDSGSYIPGHGGVLDKLDGLLVSGPVLYLIVRYF